MASLKRKLKTVKVAVFSMILLESGKLHFNMTQNNNHCKKSTVAALMRAKRLS